LSLSDPSWYNAADRVSNYTPAEIDAELPAVISTLRAEVVARVGQDRLSPSLAARLNVLAMLKRLLDLPSSASLQKRQNIISTVLNITARNEDSSTALHLAVAAGRAKVAQALILRFNAMMDSLIEVESSSAAAGDGPRVRLLAECAAQGGDTELARLFARRAKDPLLRVLCAGLIVVTGGPSTVVIDLEEREGGGGGSSGGKAERPLLVTLKEPCALRGAFPCPPGRQSCFEVEVVKAGETAALSLGFVTDRWVGGAIVEDDSTWGVAGRALKDGDLLGLGIDRERGQVFLSVNGKLEREDGARLPEGLLRAGEIRPAIAGRASAVRVNWGGSAPFTPTKGFSSVLSHAQQPH
jgi:hypothetical protein